MRVTLPADVRDLKKRVAPFFTAIDGLVATSQTVDDAQRLEWRAFSRDWHAYADAADSWANSSGDYDRGVELETKLREWRSVLAAQCPGVPSPAPKRPVGFWPTFVTTSDVRAVKTRLETALHELGPAYVRATALDPIVVRALHEFARACAAFCAEEDEITHSTAQYECAVAYEDNLTEWRAVVELVGAQSAMTPPTNAQPPANAPPPMPPPSAQPPANAPPMPPPGAFPAGAPASPSPTRSAPSEEADGRPILAFGLMVAGMVVAANWGQR